MARARAGIAYLWVEVFGHAGRPLAPIFGVHPSAIPKAARRGATTAVEWRRLLRRDKASQDATDSVRITSRIKANATLNRKLTA